MHHNEEPACSSEPDRYRVLSPDTQIELEDRDLRKHDQYRVEYREDEEVLCSHQLRLHADSNIRAPTSRKSVICTGDSVKLSVPRPFFVINSTNALNGMRRAMQARIVQSSVP